MADRKKWSTIPLNKKMKKRKRRRRFIICMDNSNKDSDITKKNPRKKGEKKNCKGK